jgi:hypothetical protein
LCGKESGEWQAHIAQPDDGDFGCFQVSFFLKLNIPSTNTKNPELPKDFAVKLWGKKLFCKFKVSFGIVVMVMLKSWGAGWRVGGLAGLRGGGVAGWLGGGMAGFGFGFTQRPKGFIVYCLRFKVYGKY